MSLTDSQLNPHLQYDMSHPRRGHALIVNQVNFAPRTRLSARSGSDADAASLHRTFQRLGFTVESRKNQTAFQVRTLLSEFSRKDHTDADCFALAVMSHGDKNVINCTDCPMGADEFTRPFRGDVCPSLIGKPKLFFFQACRGHEDDKGVVVMDDAVSQQEKMKLPTEADNFFMYATPPGYISWRSKVLGSWFMQELCRALDQWGDRYEFVQLMVTVQREVACRYDSMENGTGMKQMPVSVSQLTRLLWLLPKPT